MIEIGYEMRYRRYERTLNTTTVNFKAQYTHRPLTILPKAWNSSAAKVRIHLRLIVLDQYLIYLTDIIEDLTTDHAISHHYMIPNLETTDPREWPGNPLVNYSQGYSITSIIMSGVRCYCLLLLLVVILTVLVSICSQKNKSKAC